MHWLNSNPHYVLLAAGALAGILAGCLVAWLARRPWIWGVALSLLPVGAVVAGVMWTLANTTGREKLVAVVLAIFGFFTLAPFIVILWIAIAVGAILRARRAYRVLNRTFADPR